MKEYKYYLFDADGTLIDTLELIYQCFKKTLTMFGTRPYSREEVVAAIGMTLRHQFEHHLGLLTEERFTEIAAVHMEYQLAIYKNYLRLLPGVMETLQYCAENNKRCAVVTSRRRNTLELYLRTCNIYNFFEYFITPEDTTHHKPHAEPALKALALLGARPDEALFIGDSDFDIQCAHNAGIDSALVCYEPNALRTLTVAPTYTLAGMAQVRPDVI